MEITRGGKIKTLIFNGSPRKEGDTVSLINKTIENQECCKIF